MLNINLFDLIVGRSNEVDGIDEVDFDKVFLNRDELLF